MNTLSILKTFTLSIIILFPIKLFANGIQVSNVILTKQNTTNNTAMVQFDLSWQNSWRRSDGPANWDAAWVFVKFRVGNGNWQHAFLNNAGHVAPSGATIDAGLLDPKTTFNATTNAAMGTFIYRSENGSGTNDFKGIQLRWNYGANGVSDNAMVRLRVFAIEMVYVPEGAFYLGSGGSEDGSFTDGAHTSAEATATLSGNAIQSVTITHPGSGYSSAPNLFVWTGGSNLSSASFKVTIDENNGSVTSVEVNNGGSGYTSPKLYFRAVNSLPFQVTSEAALGIDDKPGKLWGNVTVVSGYSYTDHANIGNLRLDNEATLSANFPKGFAAFYCMKYEISQGQYRDFLNTLTYSQQASRTATAPNSAAGTGALSSTNANRNGIDIKTPGVESTTPAVYACNLDGDASYNEADDGEWIACNFLSFLDGTAYLDWAGLRPMTELEFEKACRGTQSPVSNEYAWGSSTSAKSANNITDPGRINEYSNTSNANIVSNNQVNVQGPMRVGVFAKASTTRTQSGASYYGIMELSGNLWEQVITIGRQTSTSPNSILGRNYTGTHGNGTLSSNGSANSSSWPTTSGHGRRGGSFDRSTSDASISSRILGIGVPDFINSRAFTDGFRGVRTAPN